MITSPFFGYYIFLPGTGTGCTWVVTTFVKTVSKDLSVSMPSRAWVVTAGMSNILNFLWYFLCIPAIYKCILAYLPIFFNQLSDFLRCESPNTFLGTCLSHHSFLIFLVTNTNTLLSGLYLISTYDYVNDPDGWDMCVNALSGLYLISTDITPIYKDLELGVSMPSRAYTSFLRGSNCMWAFRTSCVSMPSRAYTSFLRYPFKNLGFMRFPEPVFAGIYQNILTVAVFRAC